eukprot:gene1224-2697_t
MPTVSGNYFCHECQAALQQVQETDDGYLTCPACAQPFVEIVEADDPPNTSTLSTSPISNDQAVPPQGFPHHVFVQAGAAGQIYGAHVTPAAAGAPPTADPLAHVYQLFSGGQVNFGINQHVGEAVGDGGLNALIANLFDNFSGPVGNPPAAQDAVASLLEVQVQEGHAALNTPGCSVCMEEFCVGDTLMQMPCEHLFHRPCLLPWLHSHNSCPSCRHELPTNDPDYEARKQYLSHQEQQSLRNPPPASSTDDPPALSDDDA